MTCRPLHTQNMHSRQLYQASTYSGHALRVRKHACAPTMHVKHGVDIVVGQELNRLLDDGEVGGVKLALGTEDAHSTASARTTLASTVH